MKLGRFISLYILFSALWMLVVCMYSFSSNDPRNNSIILLLMVFFWLMYTALLALAEIVYVSARKVFSGFLWVPLAIQVISLAGLEKNVLIVQAGFTAAFVIAWFCSREATPSSPPQ